MFIFHSIADFCVSWCSGCFKISKYLFTAHWTKRKDIRITTKCGCWSSAGRCERNCCCDACVIGMWSVIFGLPSLILHFMFTMWTFPFLMFGWKFTLIHWRLCKVVLFNPNNVEIKDIDPFRGEGEAN